MVATKEQRSRSLKRRKGYIAMKKDLPCADCGVKYPPYVMQFDHVRGDKSFNIGSNTGKNFKVLADEIAKCEVVCANCHAERTHGPTRRLSAAPHSNSRHAG